MTQTNGNLPEMEPVFRSPAYRRAMWIVVILNVGYGVIELVASVSGGSQALMADALDFLGDGLVSFVALLAIGWGPLWRARTALVQGLFLAGLAFLVLLLTAYRVLSAGTPDGSIMGVTAVGGLIANLAAAAVLLPWHSEDASMRAVWLFTRNDALANIAVFIAALFVLWLDSPWPDLVVALAIATLFLDSSRSIIRDALAELGFLTTGTERS